MGGLNQFQRWAQGQGMGMQVQKDRAAERRARSKYQLARLIRNRMARESRRRNRRK